MNRPSYLPALCGREACAVAFVNAENDRRATEMNRRLAEQDAQAAGEREAAREKAEAATRARDTEAFEALLARVPRTPVRALGDGSGGVTDDTALVKPLGGTSALALPSELASLNEHVTRERRRRRQIADAANQRIDEARCKRDARTGEIENELKAVGAQLKALFIVRGRREEIETLRQKQRRLEIERRALDAAVERAVEASSTAWDAYDRFCELEYEHRFTRLRDLEQPPTKVCQTCGHEIPWLHRRHARDSELTREQDARSARYADAEPEGQERIREQWRALARERRALGNFCGDDCQGKYTRFAGEWFPRCDVCNRYFFADKNGARGDVPIVHDLSVCSYRCVLLSPTPEDVDDWPAEDAPVWRLVTYAHVPPLTSSARAAHARKTLIDAYKQVSRGKIAGLPEPVQLTPGIRGVIGGWKAPAQPQPTGRGKRAVSVSVSNETETRIHALTSKLSRGEGAVVDALKQRPAAAVDLVQQGLPKATLYRALKSLEEKGLIARGEDNVYYRVSVSNETET